MKNKKIIFFDTETNGLPRNWKLPYTAVDNWPRMAELSFIVFDTGVVDIMDDPHIFVYNEKIVPNGWTTPNEPFFIKHRLTTEILKKEGVPVHYALNVFIEWVNRADILVSHNMNFDYNVVAAEMVRQGLRAEKKLEKVCTMRATTNELKLPGKYGYKFPKLEELHQYLFDRSFDGQHSAYGDCRALVDCFFECYNKGIIKLKDDEK